MISPSWLVWMKSTSIPRRPASSTTAAAISASVTVPYTSVSRVPSRFRFGPLITMILLLIPLCFPFYTELSRPDAVRTCASDVTRSSLHQHSSFCDRSRNVDLELLPEGVYLGIQFSLFSNHILGRKVVERDGGDVKKALLTGAHVDVRKYFLHLSEYNIFHIIFDLYHSQFPPRLKKICIGSNVMYLYS